MITYVIDKINNADMVLVGIGEELSLDNCDKSELVKFFNSLAGVLTNKNVFVVNLNSDSTIFESKLNSERITAPFSDKEDISSDGEDKQWNMYMKWLSGTLNKKLVVIEFGVLLNRPNVIRWPFERIVLLNEKSHLIRINNTFPQLPVDVSKRGTSIEDNPLYFFNSIC